MNPIPKPFAFDFPVNPVIADRPSNIKAKYSGGPKLSAASAIGLYGVFALWLRVPLPKGVLVLLE